MIFSQQPKICWLNGNQLYQIMITSQIFTQQNKLISCNAHFTAQNWLDISFDSFLIKKYCSVKISSICHSNCCLSGCLYLPDKFLNPASTVRKTIFTMYMQMYKFFIMHKQSPYIIRISIRIVCRNGRKFPETVIHPGTPDRFFQHLTEFRKA